MNKYYLIYTDKLTGEVTNVEVCKTNKTLEEINSLIKKNNNESVFKRNIILSQDDLLNKVIEFKELSRKSFYDEIKSISEEIREVAYNIENQIEQFNK